MAPTLTRRRPPVLDEVDLPVMPAGGLTGWGIHGSAEVLARKATNQQISSGGAAWQGSTVYKYRLKVSIPGRDPYETDCSTCAAGVRVGSTVDVAVARHNRKRVTIDVGQHREGEAAPVGSRAAAHYPTLSVQDQPTPIIAAADRVDVLARLSLLHSQGDLTDAEFAAEKARILRQ